MLFSSYINFKRLKSYGPAQPAPKFYLVTHNLGTGNMRKSMALLFFFFISVSFGVCQNNSDENISSFSSAVTLASQGKYVEARDLFSYAAKGRYWYLDSQIYYEVCNNIINKKVQTSVGEYIFRGVYGYCNGVDFSEVMFYLNRAYGINPRYPYSYIIKGMFHLKREEYKKALFEFDQACRLPTNNLYAFYYRGETYTLLGRAAEAIADYNRALKIDNHFLPAHIKRFEMYYKQNDYERAFEDIKAIGPIDLGKVINFEYSAMVNDIGISFMQKGDLSRALDAFNLSTSLDPRWPEPLLNRGIIFRQNKKYDQSLSEINKAIELDPDLDKSYFQRALTYQQLGKLDTAEKDLLKVLFLDDKNVNAHYRLGTIYYKQGRLDKAIHYFKKTIELDDKNVWAYYWIGFSYDKKKDYRKAYEAYNKFLDRVPASNFKHKISVEKRVQLLTKYMNR